MNRRITAFLKFWYDLIVGDDWRVAVGVVIALALTYVTSTTSIPAWWVLPLIVMILLPVSLRRASRARSSGSRSGGD
jgi:hypothetical protein